jgi:hypothetical protein
MRQLLSFAVCFATLQLVVSKTTNGFDCSTACDNSIRNSWDGTICDVTPASTDWLGWKTCSDHGASSGTCKSKYKCVDKIGADGNHWSGSGFGASVGVTCRSKLREQGNQNTDSNTVPPAALTACLLP